MPVAPARLLVIADAHDVGARAVTAAFRTRHGRASVECVVAAELTTTATWEHRIRGGRALSRVQLADGRVFGDSPAAVVLNRLRAVAARQFSTATDREYAGMELHALLLSWLSGLTCPVLNPPSPAGLGGRHRSELDWLAIVSRLGLPVRTVRVTTGRRDGHHPAVYATAAGGAGPHGSSGENVAQDAAGDGPPYRWSRPAIAATSALVTGRRVTGAPRGTASMCRRLSAAVACPVLQVSLVREEARGWVIAGADPLPALADPDHVAAVVDLVDVSASR